MTEEERQTRAVIPGLGKRVRALRLAKGLMQQDLADRCGMDPAQLARVEYERKGINATTLVLLAQALETSTDYLCGNSKDPKPRRF